MMRRWVNIGTAGLAALLLLCTACGSRAASMRLRKTTGEVWVSDEAEKDVSIVEDMGLYSGYRLDTWEDSYAWIDLDSVKLAKMDADSQAEIQKSGKDLEILVNTGSVFFHVTEPLEEDETMTIRTSSMMVGIRGTCGWVTSDGGKNSQVFLLEGTVEAEAVDTGESVRVSAGEMAEVFVSETGETEISVSQFMESDISPFVLDEVDGELMDEARPFLLSCLSGEALEAAFLSAFDACKGALDQSDAQIARELEALAVHTADGGLPLPQDYEIQYRTWREAHAAELANLNAQLQTEYRDIIAGYPVFDRYVQSGLIYAAYFDLDKNGLDELILISCLSEGATEWGVGIQALTVYGAANGRAEQYGEFDFTPGPNLPMDPAFCEEFSLIAGEKCAYICLSWGVQDTYWRDYYYIEDGALQCLNPADRELAEANFNTAQYTWLRDSALPENLCPELPPDVVRKNAFLDVLDHSYYKYAKLIDMNQDGVEELFIADSENCDVYSWNGVSLDYTALGYLIESPGLYRDTATGDVYYGTGWGGSRSQSRSFTSLTDSVEFEYYSSLEGTPLEDDLRQWEEYEANLARFEWIEAISYDDSTVEQVRQQLMKR